MRRLFRLTIEGTAWIEAESEEEAIEKVCKYHHLEPDAVTEVDEEYGES